MREHGYLPSDLAEGQEQDFFRQKVVYFTNGIKKEQDGDPFKYSPSADAEYHYFTDKNEDGESIESLSQMFVPSRPDVTGYNKEQEMTLTYDEHCERSQKLSGKHVTAEADLMHGCPAEASADAQYQGCPAEHTTLDNGELVANLIHILLHSNIAKNERQAEDFAMGLARQYSQQYLEEVLNEGLGDDFTMLKRLCKNWTDNRKHIDG